VEQALVPRFENVECQAFTGQGQQAQRKKREGSKG